MKVLLTGGSGFIGRHVLHSLAIRGIETIVLGRSCPSACAVGDFMEVNLLSEPDLLGKISDLNPTHLVHLAWYVEHGKYWSSPLNLEWAGATARLAEAFCLAGGKKIVGTGTSAEYDWSQGCCNEDVTRIAPATLYGKSKDAAHVEISAICRRHDVGLAWARIFIPYGSGEDERRLIPSLIAAVKGKRAGFSINASAQRDFLHVTDVAEGLVALLLDSQSGVYNISSGQPIELSEIVCKIARNCNVDPQFILNLSVTRPDDQPVLFGKNQKLLNLGWLPTRSLDDGLREFLCENEFQRSAWR